MKTIIDRANTRGKANFGWLDSSHSFSFGRYYNPQKMGFGLLRVLNDDYIAPGTGFGRHPHDNMEIISVPISGGLAHQDSEGNEHEIRAGEVQIMSAGTGIEHAEMNLSKTETTNFLQLWIFPKRQNIKPNYAQKNFPAAERKNKIQTIVSPTDEEALWINQDAVLSLANFEKEQSADYKFHFSGNGVYAFVIKGQIAVGDQVINQRDAIGIYDTEQFSFKALDNAEVLLIEVPLN